MTCREAIDVLADDLDASLDERRAGSWRPIWRGARNAARIGPRTGGRWAPRPSRRVEMPEALRQRLRAFLLECLHGAD
jgi:hypothetical protein